MDRVWTIADLQNAQNGAIIPVLECTLSNAYPPEVKQKRQGGTVTLQRGEITDGQVAYDLVVWDHADISSLIGQPVTLESWNSPQRGLLGVTIKDDTYNNQFKREIHISKTGNIKPAGGGQQPQHQPQAQPQQHHAPAPPRPVAQQPQQAQFQPQPQARPAPAHQPRPAGSSGKGVGHVKEHLNRLSNLSLLCWQAVDYEREQLRKAGFTMTEALFQGRWSSMFIESCKNGHAACVPTGVYEVVPFGGNSGEPEPERKEPNPPPAQHQTQAGEQHDEGVDQDGDYGQDTGEGTLPF
jgi:hypothetical protein